MGMGLRHATIRTDKKKLVTMGVGLTHGTIRTDQRLVKNNNCNYENGA